MSVTALTPYTYVILLTLFYAGNELLRTDMITKPTNAHTCIKVYYIYIYIYFFFFNGSTALYGPGPPRFVEVS
jgi:hypothetical protein